MTSSTQKSNYLSKIHEIRLKDISVSKDNVRKQNIDTDLQELAESIKRHGQLQPVVLLGEFGKPPYEIIIGQRRYIAFRDILNVHTIKATFAGKISNVEASIRSLAENMIRSDLSYEDTANAVTQLYKHFGRDDHRVHKETGLSLRKVRQFIHIEERASKKTKSQLRQGEITPVDVQRALWAASDDINKADELLELMKKYKFDKFQKGRMVEYGKTNPRASAREIIERAKPPAVERTFIVKLSENARKALIMASEKLAMNPDELAAFAVEEWLMEKGFVV